MWPIKSAIMWPIKSAIIKQFRERIIARCDRNIYDRIAFAEFTLEDVLD